nr:DUF2341 domain-containing protein [Hyphomicrobium sp. CS1BSMeth3]
MAVFTLALVLGGTAGSAQAWWNDEWSLRKKITLDTSPMGAGITDAVGTMPILVRLHVGNFRFGQAKEDGSDLRFVASDDKTPLKHHIEKYDALLGEALLWVNVPNIQPGAKADVWLYYGNKKATSVSDPKGTYGSETVLVYHFAERGTPAQDASVWANAAQNAGQAADGSQIGTGARLDGSTAITIPASTSLTFAQDGQLTWSILAKLAALQRNAVLYSRREGTNALLIGFDDGAPFVEITANGTTQRTAAGPPVAPGGWHHIGMVATPGLVTLYLDGNPYASLAATLPPLNSVALLGGDTTVASAPAAETPVSPSSNTSASSGETVGQSAQPTADTATPAAPDASASPAPAPTAVAPPSASVATSGFAGDVDELVIIKAARPAGYIKATAINQGSNPTKLVVFAPEEETSSWMSGHFGVLLRSVTVDGWIVIGILLVMAVASWMVMVEKTSYLGRQRKANSLFMAQFRLLDDDLTALAVARNTSESISRKERAVRRNSSLHRLYQIAASEIHRRYPVAHSSRPLVLSAETIGAIRSAVDAGVVREVQRLNRMMVILTIAISGGPFLGLLGTVIGVMITFAAIAMSGDVNINAIAPGVAGALVATVAGLAVAIPALFGYNWLTLRIRDLTSDMQVFVEELTSRMAETYSSNRPDPVEQHRLAAE